MRCIAPSPSCETLNKLVHLSEPRSLDFKSNTLVVVRDRVGDPKGDCYGLQSSSLEGEAVLEINQVRVLPLTHFKSPDIRFNYHS